MFFLAGALVYDAEGGGGEEFLLGFPYKQTGDRSWGGGGLEETECHIHDCAYRVVWELISPCSFSHKIAQSLE